MTPDGWVLARATTPRGDLLLRRRQGGEPGDAVVELRVNGVFVMDTADVDSETALATLALDAADAPVHVLVAGLGLGFTLRAVLSDARVHSVTVVELEPGLVEWLRADLVPGGADLLSDPRVQVRVDDIRDVVAAASAQSVDLLLLDVDNGPDHLVHVHNDRLYEQAFVRRITDALTPRGVLGIWSMTHSTDLEHTLAAAFAEVRATACPVRLQEREETYWVYVAAGPLASGS